ncbi:hypothetical protein DPPLL_27400 [Desulfofustis limnaeus]|uniref:Uncharacterized protein n=1 Tax=Desulfofustis limnaeus TaxID=2740163 RepID=A0ABM7WBP9_9BACT|nr:hypothetical protein DPPLL_27400 [Desulfofustis limnaeus]
MPTVVYWPRPVGKRSARLSISPTLKQGATVFAEPCRQEMWSAALMARQGPSARMD